LTIKEIEVLAMTFISTMTGDKRHGVYL
jgi:hypothetical protein